MARARRAYTSGREHLTTGQAFRMRRVDGQRAHAARRSSGFYRMPGGSPTGELSMVAEAGQRGIRGRTIKATRTPSRMPALFVDPRSIEAFYNYAQDMRDNAERFRWAMDKILMMYAYIALAGAQKRSLGPVDPAMQNAAAAWRVPVRRITGDYFLGWEVKHVSLGVWALTNNSREAFYIEFGINHAATTGKTGPGGMRVRIRRPIMKLAVLEAVNIVRETHAGIDELVSSVTSHSLYQSPYITGAIRPRGQTGSAIGLVNVEALQNMATGGGT